jgi:adenosylhomocysteine nucleosidase
VSSTNITLSTLVCFAFKEEAQRFRQRLGDRPQIKTLLSGMGRQNAERAVRKFLEANSPKSVLTCGFAGGLNPELKLGDVVFLTTQPALDEALVRAGAKRASFFCAPRVVTTATEKAELWHKTGADAVEMESEVIHALCRERGISCATVRVISDTADEDLPLDFNELIRPDLSVDYPKLVWAVAKSPGKIGALLKLQKRSHPAAEKLAQVLVEILA